MLSSLRRMLCDGREISQNQRLWNYAETFCRMQSSSSLLPPFSVAFLFAYCPGDSARWRSRWPGDYRQLIRYAVSISESRSYLKKFLRLSAMVLVPVIVAALPATFVLIQFLPYNYLVGWPSFNSFGTENPASHIVFQYNSHVTSEE